MLVLSNLIIMRDMRRQGATGDLMDMVWWFSGGRKLGESTATQGKPSLGTFLFGLGRRDAGDLLVADLRAAESVRAGPDHGGIIALAWFVASVVQLVVRPAPAAR